MKKLATTLMMTVLLFLPIRALAEEVSFASCEFPPRSFIKDREAAGIDVEIIREVCNRIGIRPTFQILPWIRAQKYVKEGRADAIFSLKQNEERNKFLLFTSEPTYTERIVAIARKDSGIKATGLDELRDKRFGVGRGYAYGPKFDNYQGLEKTKCNDDEQMLRILDKGRIDVGVGEEGNLKSVSKKLGLEDRFKTVCLIDEISLYIGFSKKALGEKGESIVKKFSKALAQLKAERIIQKIENKYH